MGLFKKWLIENNLLIEEDKMNRRGFLNTAAKGVGAAIAGSYANKAFGQNDGLNKQDREEVDKLDDRDLEKMQGQLKNTSLGAKGQLYKKNIIKAEDVIRTIKNYAKTNANFNSLFPVNYLSQEVNKAIQLANNEANNLNQEIKIYPSFSVLINSLMVLANACEILVNPPKFKDANQKMMFEKQKESINQMLMSAKNILSRTSLENVNTFASETSKLIHYVGDWLKNYGLFHNEDYLPNKI